MYINIYIFLSLEIGYFLADYGKLCSWTGDIAVDVQRLCEVVAEELGFTFCKTCSVIEDDFPKGCYENAGLVRFNHHLTGSAHRASHQICRNRHTKGMKLFRCLYFHILIRLITAIKSFTTKVLNVAGKCETNEDCVDEYPICTNGNCGKYSYPPILWNNNTVCIFNVLRPQIQYIFRRML